MKHTRFLRAVCLLLALILPLTGCAIHNRTLDGQMERVITALNRQDREALKALADPNLPEADLDAVLDQMFAVWHETDPAEARLVNLHVEKSGSRARYTGVYWLPETEDYNALQLVYESTDGEGTIQYLFLGTSDSAGVPNRATYLLGLPIVAWILFTIADILRKRPGKYGLLIFVALLSAPLPVGSVILAIPIGSVLYWCIRKQLLRKKAEANASTE